MEKRKAFTLAEVLIVLAIIGVVAALTMPMLMNNYQKTQQVVALKKVYSQISEAIDRVMIDNDSENFNEIRTVKGPDADPKAFFKQYFRVSKYCDKANYDSCFPAEYGHINKSEAPSNRGSVTDYCVVLKDGSSICMGYSKGASPSYFLVDTNGLAKPNIAGRDIFSFYVYHDGSIDAFDPNGRDTNDPRREIEKERCDYEPYGAGCFTRVFDAGWKMDY